MYFIILEFAILFANFMQKKYLLLGQQSLSLIQVIQYLVVLGIMGGT